MFNRPITAEGAKLPGPAIAASDGIPARPEELTQGDEIPSQLGGSASTWGPERTAPPQQQRQAAGRYDKLEPTTRPSRARTTEPAKHHHLGDGMDRRNPSHTWLVVGEGERVEESLNSPKGCGPRVE